MVAIDFGFCPRCGVALAAGDGRAAPVLPIERASADLFDGSERGDSSGR